MRPNRWCALVLLGFLSCATAAHAQVYSNKKTIRMDEAIVDSLKQLKYPYMLPIWGAKAVQRGFDLPHSAGVSLQYFGQRSDLLIDNLMVGFNNGPLFDLDGIVRFDKARSSSDGVSLRPDLWLFPFLNVYGILGVSSASTDVGYSLWLPDSSGHDQQVVSLSSKVDFTAKTFGLGLTPTMGVKGAWLALDMNFTWTDVPQLDQPATAFVFDPRLGKSFTLRRRDENVNVWIGGFRFKINTGTSGSIPLGDALPIDQWNATVEQGMQRVAEADPEVDASWNSLTPPQQANPVNRARYDAAKAAIARAGSFLAAADGTVDNAANSTVQYSLDKRPKDLWNFLVGGQYQLNKSWMARLEVGFLTSRTQVIAGVQYRFPL